LVVQTSDRDPDVISWDGCWSISMGIMINKKILFGLLILGAFILFVLTIPINLDSEPLMKQGILADVLISEDGMITLCFSDGEDVFVKEDNLEDSQEMYEYMSGWIGEEIILGYSYDFYLSAYEIDNVSPVS